MVTSHVRGKKKRLQSIEKQKMCVKITTERIGVRSKGYKSFLSVYVELYRDLFNFFENMYQVNFGTSEGCKSFLSVYTEIYTLFCKFLCFYCLCFECMTYHLLHLISSVIRQVSVLHFTTQHKRIALLYSIIDVSILYQ